MYRRLIFILSAGLNLLLVLVILNTQRRPTPAPAPAPEVVVVGTNTNTQRVVVRKQFFSWQELESTDYQTYVNNLHNIGCPEQTIRDIINADVNQMYAWRRLTEVISPDQEWWRSEPDTNLVAAAISKRVALDQERRDLLTTLLGTNWNAGAVSLNSLVTLSGPVLGELATNTKHSVQEILTRAQQRMQAYLNAQTTAGKKPTSDGLIKLDKQLRTDLAQVLNPAQLEEFLLRNSDTATNLRHDLSGIDMTPDDFRNLFRLVDPLNTQVAEFTGTDQQTRDDFVATSAKQYQEDLKNILGTDRYEEYRVAHDPIYRDAVAQAEEAGASPEAAQSLYLLLKAIQGQRDGILNNANLTAEQKAQQLNALALQQQNGSDQILGVAPPEAPAAPIPPLPPGLNSTPMQVHSYFPGESVNQIAAQYGVSVNAILNANPNVNFNGLTKGTAINIPHPQP